ncbi:MAG: DUF2169 domain-containing protein [Polyangiaceae bacterium]|nr:DUF2169 domain-containing protein [Polyangiaceae bacterium]
MTVVVKATFQLTHGARVVRTAPAPVVRQDKPFGNNPTRSVEYASELAPSLAKCDVTFVGSAYVPGGTPASATSVRLAVFREGRAILDKTLHVFGDRKGGEGPLTFVKMPLVYEKALGGIGVDSNPVGVDIPNVTDPKDSKVAASFAPVSRYWPVRKKLLSASDRAAMEGAIPTVGETIAPGYWQCAPVDQQVEFVKGDEWIVLDGLHPTLPRVQTQLSGARGVARLVTPTGDVRLDLVADMLAIDGDKKQCSIVWRGKVAGLSEEQIRRSTVCAALEIPGIPVVWPEVKPRAAEVVSNSVQSSASSGEGTLTLKPEEQLAAAHKVVAPYEVAKAGEGGAAKPIETSATPWSPVSTQPVVSTPGGAGEGELTLAPRLSSMGPATPFGEGRSTHEVGEAKPLDLSATPWSGAPLAVVPRAAVGEETVASVVDRPPSFVPVPVEPPPMVGEPKIAPTPMVGEPKIAPTPVSPGPTTVGVHNLPAPTQEPRSEKVVPKSKPRPATDPESLAARLAMAGASSDDVESLLSALRPKAPPPEDDG